MICPYCRTTLNYVVDSRPRFDETTVWRRRHCEKCRRKFTTYEILEAEADELDNLRDLFQRIGSMMKDQPLMAELNSYDFEIETIGPKGKLKAAAVTVFAPSFLQAKKTVADVKDFHRETTAGEIRARATTDDEQAAIAAGKQWITRK